MSGTDERLMFATYEALQEQVDELSTSLQLHRNQFQTLLDWLQRHDKQLAELTKENDRD